MTNKQTTKGFGGGSFIWILFLIIIIFLLFPAVGFGAKEA